MTKSTCIIEIFYFRGKYIDENRDGLEMVLIYHEKNNNKIIIIWIEVFLI